jgi:hypothetical protein
MHQHSQRLLKLVQVLLRLLVAAQKSAASVFRTPFNFATSAFAEAAGSVGEAWSFSESIQKHINAFTQQ